jgi:hypothetical protein
MKHKTEGTTPPVVTEDVVQEIADEASVDIRSVWKRLAGGKLRTKAQARIDQAIARRRQSGARA